MRVLGKIRAMWRVFAAMGVAFLLAVAGAACGTGDERLPASPTPSATPTTAPTPVATQAPTSTITPTATPSPTAVASATPSPTPSPTPPASYAQPLPDAVREVLAEMAALRRIASPPGLRAATVSRADLPALIEEAITEDEFRRFGEITTLYRLLGHLRPDQEYWEVLKVAFSGGVVGLYDPSGKQLWVVTDGAGLDDLSGRQRETLAHELMHALQDHYADLTTMLDGALGDLDRELAARAVVEGDAEYHTRRWAEGAARGWRPGGARLLLLGTLPQTGEVPEAIIREIFFPYEWGEVWAGATIERGGLAAINAALRDPPPATTHIIHPDTAPDWTPETVALPPLADALGAGWTLESEGPLGEFQLLNYLLPERTRFRGVGGNTDAAEAAAGWVGDRHAVYVNGGASVMAARVRFADAEEAREFDATHRAALANADAVTEGALTLATRADGATVALAEPVGREVLFVIGSDAAIARAALEALLGG